MFLGGLGSRFRGGFRRMSGLHGGFDHRGTQGERHIGCLSLRLVFRLFLGA